jgi:hypothetical protein
MRACVLLLFLVSCVATGLAGETLPKGAIQVDEDALVWSAGPRSLPPGTEIVVLEGDPRGRGIFTMRLRIEDETVIAPHWHPRAERVTVLSGKLGVGFGDKFDLEKLRYFTAGDFYVNPPKSHHYLYFARDSEVQITAEGPWEIHYLEQR